MQPLRAVDHDRGTNLRLVRTEATGEALICRGMGGWMRGVRAGERERARLTDTMRAGI